MSDSLRDDSDVSHAYSGTKTSWGVSYEWKDLPGDIEKMTGVNIDQVINELENAAKKGNMDLDIDYGLSGSAHYFMEQYPDGETSVRLASGKAVDVEKRVTEITVRAGAKTSFDIKTDWSDGDVGFEFDASDSSKGGIWLDIKTIEFFTSDEELVGADMTAEGAFEIAASSKLDGKVYADGDEVKFSGTSLDIDFKFELKAMEVEWRLEEESSIYSDLASGHYDRVYWDCDTSYDSTTRDSRNIPDGYSWWDSDYPYGVETSHDYYNNDYSSWSLNYYGNEDLEGSRLYFRDFYTEAGYDVLKVKDASTGEILDTLSGSLGSYYYTKWYPTTDLDLIWTSDDSDTNYGFELYRVEYGKFYPGYDRMDIEEDCGEMDIKWSTAVSYDMQLKNFPATDLGFTSSQNSVRFSDSFTESLQVTEKSFSMYDYFTVSKNNFEVETADGKFDTVRVNTETPIPFITAELMDESFEYALQSDDLEDLADDLEDEFEDWDRDYDHDDNEIANMERDFERSDLEDDMEDFGEEFIDAMEDIDDDSELKFRDGEFFMLIDEDSFNMVSPQFILEDEDGDKFQLIGPAKTDFEPVKTSDKFEIEFAEGPAAESKKSNVEELKKVDDLVQGSLQEESGFEMWMVLVGIGSLLILILPVVLFMRRDNSDYLDEGVMWDDPPVKTGVPLPGMVQPMPMQQPPPVVQQPAPVIQQAPPPMAAPTPQVPVRNCPNCGEGGVWYPEQKWHWCQLCNDWLP